MSDLENGPAIGLYVGEQTAPERVFRKFDDLIDALHSQGATAFAINEGSEFDGEMRTWQNAVQLEESSEASFAVSDVPVGSVRDFTAKMPENTGVPTLNERSVLAIARDKGRLYGVCSPDMAPAYVVGEELLPEDIEQMAYELNADSIVCKPLNSYGGKDVFIASKQLVVAHALEKHRKGERFLLQEAVDTTTYDPAIQGIDADNQSLLEAGALSYELRLFGNNGNFFPVLRHNRAESKMGKQSKTIFVDPDSVPTEFYDMADRSYQRLVAATGVTEICAAYDMTGTRDDVRLMEINAKEAPLPKSRAPEAIRRDLNGRLAAQLIRMAQ